MIKYLKIPALTNGVITHEDKEESALTFEVIKDSDEKLILKVEGKQNDIENWAGRNNATEINNEDYSTKVKFVKKEQLKAVIKELSDEVKRLQAELDKLA